MPYFGLDQQAQTASLLIEHKRQSPSAPAADSAEGGRSPRFRAGLAHVLCTRFQASSAKAERELGYQSRDFSSMVEDTYQWLHESKLFGP